MSHPVNIAGTNVIRMPKLSRETISSLFTDVDVTSTTDINCVFATASIGRVSLIRAIHSSENCASHRSYKHMDDGALQYVFACIPIQGQMKIRHVGRDCTIKPGSFAVVVTDEEYSIHMSDDLDAIWVRIPEHQLRPYVLSMDRSLCRPIDMSQGVGPLCRDMILSTLHNSANKLSPRSSALITQTLLGFLGEMTNFGMEDNSGSSSPHCRKILARAYDYIEEQLGDEELNPDMVADAIGISRRYLSQLFAAEGTSVMRWVRTRRLEKCRSEFENAFSSRKPIQDIAYGLGFTNISSFNRAFKAQYGMSPRELMEANTRSVA